MHNHRLPALKALLTLQAVVKYQSISQAAKALFVTHSAVSQTIKQLEQSLGGKLFTRVGRNIVATANTLAYVAQLNEHLEGIAHATKAFQLREAPDTITLKMVSTLALRWFIPKLTMLQAQHPTIKIKLVTESVSDINDLPNDVDAAIGFATDNAFANLYRHKLHASELVLVCKTAHQSPQQVVTENMAIYADTGLRVNDWQHWCYANNVAQPLNDKKIMLPNSALALEALSAGAGVMVTQKIFVQQLLDLELLHETSKPVVNPAQGYYFYCRPEQIHRPSIRLLLDWLLFET
ncbi:MAG: LysR family transcriptional regulator [Paraglaciecola sp.]|nr:LysR family transcriptional regulator [Paraglaciecola sp.]